MTFWFLGILGLAWLAVFLPAALRAREATPLSATQRFKRGMDLISPATPGRGRYVVVPKSSEEIRSRRFRRSQQRRKRILEVLLVSTAASFLLAVFFGGRMWNLNAALAVSLVLYVGLLIGTKRQREEATSKVRHIGGQRTRVPSEDVVFHEPATASGGSRN